MAVDVPYNSRRVPDRTGGAQSSSWCIWWSLGIALLCGLTHPFLPLLLLLLGVGQWSWLRRILPDISGWWIVGTIVGGTLAFATIATPIDWPPAGLFATHRLIIGAVAGLLLGCCQGIFLQQWSQRIAWALGSALGTTFFWPIYLGIYELARNWLTLASSGVQPAIPTVYGFGPVTTTTLLLWLVQGWCCGLVYACPLGWLALRISSAQQNVKQA